MDFDVQERLTVSERDSAISTKSGIIVSISEILSSEAKLVVGRPGQPNVAAKLGAGGAILFEAPGGLFEVRLLKIIPLTNVTVLITRVSPRPGLAAGFVDQDQSNANFSADERKHIELSVRAIFVEISNRSDVTPEQLAFLERKLDDMQAASERMGRKDWINLALGTLSSVVVTAALDPEAAKALFQAADSALSWLFPGAVKLLP